MSVFLQPIYTQTVGSGGASAITFNNIPQTFTDLVIKMSVRAAGPGPMDAYLNFQDGTGTTSYSWTRLSGDGTGGGIEAYRSSNSGTMSPYTMQGTDATSNTFTSVEIYIPNYSGSNYKQVVSENGTENNASTVRTSLSASLWRNTSAITQLNFGVAYGFAQYSTVSVYGVLRQGI